ncbi:Aste57867_11892 [Aphanomyces stellatus]|uniref:NADPH--hemoprotein reductase n=1 Tax=Aphanomyces stellatus TaxID=120398 RepID=A0A485KVD3_9STRA|nr:hypothetical protein As57867_011847 [Aphanomyces stellatus]VFT88747.1 Aste57867_11892 [Aphanomyces stellatus]
MLGAIIRRQMPRRQPRAVASFSMDAFLDFERDLARKKRAAAPPQPPKRTRLEPPRKPLDGECCDLNCPNCVLLVYNEQLLEYEDSARWANASGTSSTPQSLSQPSMDLAMTWAPKDMHIDVPAFPRGVSTYPVVTNRLLCQSPTRAVHQVDVSLPESTTYATAQNFCVHMPNNDTLVTRCASFLGVSAAALVKVDHPTKPFPKNEWLTLGKLLRWHVDLASTPRPRILRMLTSYATSPDDQARLVALADALSFTMSLVDVLEAHPSLKLTVEAFLNLAPALTARNYTIASSPRLQPHTVSLTVAVKPTEGRCSVYLTTRQQNSVVHASLAPSSFSQTWATGFGQAPLLCIAAGTGIAPFRGLWQELAQREAAARPLVALFFGCRDPDEDFLYHSDIDAMAAAGVLTHVEPVFSQRDAKQHVQDRLKSPAGAALVADYVVRQGGAVYICGSLAMGRDVKHALVECLASDLQWSTDNAKAYIAQMQHDGRYVAEVW